MKRRWAALLALLVLTACAAAEDSRYAAVFDRAGEEGKLTVRFLWLGEQTAKDKPGDSMILTSPDGKVMLLDAGHPDAAPRVIRALDAMGVKRIDYLVASHPHIDHIGGMAAVIRRYDIGALYTSALTYEASAPYRAFMEAAGAKQLPHVILREGDTFRFGECVRVDVFNPPADFAYPRDYPRGATQFINNHSLALKFTYGKSTLMLAGDLYMGGERSVAARWGGRLDCDVMKANHHGDNTSSCSAWRKAVSPQITVITAHLIEDLTVAKKFARGGQRVYHTFLDGCIRLSMDGSARYEVLTEKDRQTGLLDSAA